MIKFACPGCHATLSVEESVSGKKVRCPKCDAVVDAPSVGNVPRKPVAAARTSAMDLLTEAVSVAPTTPKPMRYPYQGQYPASGQGRSSLNRAKGLGIASLILGILGILSYLALRLLVMPFAILGAVLGIIGVIFAARDPKFSFIMLSGAGAVVCAIALICAMGLLHGILLWFGLWAGIAIPTFLILAVSSKRDTRNPSPGSSRPVVTTPYPVSSDDEEDEGDRAPATQVCENCGHAIGKLEKPWHFDEHVVCKECFERLSK